MHYGIAKHAEKYKNDDCPLEAAACAGAHDMKEEYGKNQVQSTAYSTLHRNSETSMSKCSKEMDCVRVIYVVEFKIGERPITSALQET